MSTASISLRGVGRTFGATPALADVDLDLRPGVIGLLGRNGAGRTTLLRLLATALPPTQGKLSVLGLDPEVPAVRGLALPWAAAGLALAGNVLLGFAAACVVRTRTGEPGAAAGAAVVLVLMTPSLVPQVARWVRTFPGARRRAVPGHRVVDHPRGVRGGHRHLGRRPKPAPADDQGSMILAASPGEPDGC